MTRPFYAAFLAAFFFSPVVFSQIDSAKTYHLEEIQLQVFNPTQLFSSIGVGLNINAEQIKEISYLEVLPDFVFSGSLKIKQFQFDMSLPIGTKGNLSTLAGDVKLRTSFQIKTRNVGLYQTTLLFAGMQLPTGFEQDPLGGNYAFENLSRPGHFKFNIGYIGDLRFNHHFSIYPAVEVYFKASPITTSFPLNPNPDTCSYPARATERGLLLANTFSWKFYKGDFIQFTPSYTWGFRQSISQCEYRNYYLQKSVGGFSFDLKYQHRINTNSYLIFRTYFEAVSIKNFEINWHNPYIGNATNAGLFFGYKYYLD